MSIVMPVTHYRGVVPLEYLNLLVLILPVSQTYDIPKFHSLSSTFLFAFMLYH